MSLARQVGRVTPTGLLAVGLVAVVNTAILAYLAFGLDHRLVRATDAAREVRAAHLAMVDQETGLRAFLITGHRRFLQPYRAGVRTMRNQLVAARSDADGQPELTRLLAIRQDRIDAWSGQWAQRTFAETVRTSGEALLTVINDVLDYSKDRVGQPGVARALDAHDRDEHRDAALEPVGTLRILLVEDNQVNQQVATLVLERLGQHPDVVDNGQLAVDAMRSTAYDLVLMDV